MGAAITSETISNLPIIIVDQEGSIGLGLYAKVKQYLQVVLVGGHEPEKKENMLFLHWGSSMPVIPQDQYSHIFLVVNTKKESEEMLEPCAKKAEEDNAKLIIIIAKELATSDRLVSLIPLAKNTSALVYGEIIDNPYSKEKNFIESVFHLAKQRKTIKLSDMGMRRVYPVSYIDVVNELVKLGFNNPKSRGVYLCFPPFPVTELGVVHALQKVDPVIKIDFETSDEVKERQVEGEYLLENEYPVFEKIEEAYKNYKVKAIISEENVIPNPPTTYIKEILQNKKKNPIIVPIIVFLLTCLFLPWIVFLSTAFAGKQTLLGVKGTLEKGDIVSSKQQSQLSFQFFEVAIAMTPLLFQEANLVGQGPNFNTVTQQLYIASQVSTQFSDFADALISVKEVFAGKAILPGEQLLSALNTGKRVFSSFERIASIPNAPAEITSQLSKRKDLIHMFSLISDVLPDILGLNGDRRYLVLFQNNMELRPGGGFIGSYGLLSLHNGMVKDFSIHDVYDADGQLKGHIEPPFAIRRYIPLVHLYLRDSNFDMDYLKNASAAAYLLSQETGDHVDGVMGIDLSVVQSLLKATGPIYLPDYTEYVNADTVFSLTETHADKNSFAGSTQKKDFLKSLFIAIESKVQQGSGMNYGVLANNIVNNIEQKDILFAFDKGSIQDVFTVNGLSSSLWDGRSTQQNTFLDFLGINEANLAVNKVNYFVKRSVDQHATLLSDGTINETLTTVFTNTSDGTWPGGNYKNFVRFALPQGTIISTIAIDGQVQKIVSAITDPAVYEAKNFIPPSGLEVQKEEEQGKTLYGFLINVPQQSETHVQITYTLPQKMPITSLLFRYNMRILKQPGVTEYPYSLSLTYPNGIKVISANPGAHTEGNTTRYNTSIIKDTDFHATFSKQ